MAGRPRKTTIDYFPHDTYASHGRTLTILQNKCGNDGVLVWWRLLEILGRSDGLFYHCGDLDSWEFLVAEMHVSDISVTEILNLLAKLGAIDASLWGQKIIWCQNFVDRLSQIFDKRKDVLPSKPVISVTEIPISVTEIPISVTENTQSKLKDSKPKEIRVNNTVPKKAYGTFENVLLTDEEYTKLMDRFNNSLPAKIGRLSEGIASKGYKYKSHYATILSWDRNEKERGHVGSSGVNQEYSRSLNPRAIPKQYTRPKEHPDRDPVTGKLIGESASPTTSIQSEPLF